jgi:hypothetical protein
VDREPVRARIDNGHTTVMALVMQIGRRNRAVKILQRRAELVGMGRRLGFSAGDRAPSVFGKRPQRFVVSTGAASCALTRSGVRVSAAAAPNVVNAVRRVTPCVCRFFVAIRQI